MMGCAPAPAFCFLRSTDMERLRADEPMRVLLDLLPMLPMLAAV
jgi:hypothetical protein